MRRDIDSEELLTLPLRTTARTGPKFGESSVRIYSVGAYTVMFVDIYRPKEDFEISNIDLSTEHVS
jgi:hypothetical protein